MISVLLWIAMQGVPQMRPEFCAINGETMQYEGDCAKPSNNISPPEGGSIMYAPEPMDVPAIKENRRECVRDETLHACPADEWGSACPCPNKWADVAEYTCADKSRILLTSEDGVRHCVKF